MEYHGNTERVLLDIKALLVAQFPLTTGDRFLGGRLVPTGSIDDHSEQGNCAYERQCSLGRTIYVQNIGPVAHARFSPKPRQLAEHGYYLKEARINGVSYTSYFIEEVRLSWNEALASPYQKCLPPAQFIRLSQLKTALAFSIGRQHAKGAGITQIVSAHLSFGPIVSPGISHVQLGQLVFALNPNAFTSEVELQVHESSSRVGKSPLGTYVIFLRFTEAERSSTLVCYLFIEA
jgi:hypothetical protein